VRFAEDEAPVEQARERFLDLVGGKLAPQLGDELAKRPAAFSDRRSERAIELAVEKELAVLRIEADDVAGQQINGEIRREARNVVAGVLRDAVAAIAGHELSKRATN
jgi:hypothetical protein